MKVEISDIIKTTGSLPSLPAIATKIVTLAQDPQINIQLVADVLAKDPAMASKVLRMVNSAMYVTQRHVENLHQAIVIMGLNQTMSMALSFSLVSTMKKQQGSGLDYEHFWRRMLLSAAAARVIGGYVGEDALEELFLAGLLQDIGMLALDRAKPDFYSGLGRMQYSHKELITYEKERMSGDHAALGGELLNSWNLADRTCNAVKYSHNPLDFNKANIQSKFIRSVALSSSIADLFINDEQDRPIHVVGQLARSYLNLEYGDYQNILESFSGLIPEMEELFETNFVCEENAEKILDQAREMLVKQNIEAITQLEKLKQKTKRLDAETRMIKESGFRDAITGVYNRDYVDGYLGKVFMISRQTSKPISLLYVSLGKLMDINHQYGHAVGDRMLRLAAKTLKDNVQTSSVIGRYGGGEFVIVLPGEDSLTAKDRCQQISNCFNGTTYTLEGVGDINLTASIGRATQGGETEYKSVQDFFAAAETSLYQGESVMRENASSLKPQ